MTYTASAIVKQQAKKIAELEAERDSARAWSALWKRAYKTLWIDWSDYEPRDQHLTLSIENGKVTYEYGITPIENESALGGDA
jgi:hypothetical protein